MFDRTESKWSFSGDIHRVATFTHVSSLTVVAGIFSCPLHGSQRFLCLLLISSKVATNLGTNMYAHIVYSYSHLTFWIPGWLWQPLTLWPTALFDILRRDKKTFWHWRSIWTFCCFPCSLLVPVVMLPFVRLYLSCASRLFFSFDMQPDGGVLSTKVATFELHRVVGKHQDRLTLVGHLNDIYAPR